jgi:hypothetical protein
MSSIASLPVGRVAYFGSAYYLSTVGYNRFREIEKLQTHVQVLEECYCSRVTDSGGLISCGTHVLLRYPHCNIQVYCLSTRYE